MIRVLIFIVIVGLVAVAAVWLADRPGDVAITWQGQLIETSVMVLVSAVVAVAALAIFLWSILSAIARAPAERRRRLRERRSGRGFRTLSRGLVAVASGDARAARRFAEEASRIAPDEPLALLLTAQASQLSGDREAAERTFRTMAARPDTRLLALHGLFIEAQRRGDGATARFYAEEAASETSVPGSVPAWAGHAVFAAACAAGDWTGALERLDRNMKSGLVDRAAYARQRAVLLTARALAAEEHDRETARALALEAVGLAPTFVPAAALAARLLGEAGELRKAARIVETAWKANPHPDLAETHAHLRPGDSARERLARVRALAQLAPGHVESALAVARAALDAQEFAIAREALAPLVVAPTQRVAVLMAEIEERQHGDVGRAREWMARAVRAWRDPAWTADGIVSDRWMPVSPVTGRLDAFEWKVPLAQIGPGVGPVIEGRSSAVVERPDRAAPLPQDLPRTDGRDAAPLPAPAATPAAAAAPSRIVRTQTTPRPEAAPAVAASGEPASPPRAIERAPPLAHMPDDPGPEPERAQAPEPERSDPRPAFAQSLLRALFG
jgi:HemY protein